MSACIALFSNVINLVCNLICAILSESELCNLNGVGNKQQQHLKRLFQNNEA